MSEILLTARASSLPTFADCPARWYAQQVEGLNSPPSARTALGSAIHASTTVYDQHVIDGDPVRADEAAGAAVDYLREHADEIDWSGDDLRPRDTEAIALSLHGRYCSQIAPTRRYVACEVPLGRMEVDTGYGVVVVLTGTGDRIREEFELGEPVEIVSDLKSGKNAVGADGAVEVQAHAAQTASYKLLRHQATGIAMSRKTEIIGLQTGKTPHTQRVGVGFAEDVEETLIGTPDKPGLLHVMGLMARHGAFHGNPKSVLCTARYCPVYHRCHFRK